jgi:hypothetical protein
MASSNQRPPSDLLNVKRLIRTAFLDLNTIGHIPSADVAAFAKVNQRLSRKKKPLSILFSLRILFCSEFSFIDLAPG